MLVDTHGHINFNAFKDDGDEVVRRAFDQGVAIIAPGSQIDTSRRAVEYAERFNDPRLRAAIGLHPIHLEDIRVDDSEVEGQFKFKTRQEEFRHSSYEDLLKRGGDKVVAIGEVGLDYWRKPKTTAKKEAYKRKQIDTLVQQLDLAWDYKLPVILHCRVAHDDLLEVVESHPITRNPSAGGAPGVVHSYTGDAQQLKAFLALGYYIGFNGIIFKLDLDEIIKKTPLNRILLETDSPYLTPPLPSETLSKEGRNEPIFVKYIAQRIAELKGVEFEKAARQTTENAKKVFGLNI